MVCKTWCSQLVASQGTMRDRLEIVGGNRAGRSAGDGWAPFVFNAFCIISEARWSLFWAESPPGSGIGDCLSTAALHQTALEGSHPDSRLSTCILKTLFTS